MRGSGGVADKAALLREVLAFGTYKITHSYTVLSEEGRVKKRPICSQACTFNCQDSFYATAADGRRQPGQCYVEGRYMDGTAYAGGSFQVPPNPNFELPVEARLHELCNDLGIDMWFRIVMQLWFLRCLEADTRCGTITMRPHIDIRRARPARPPSEFRS